MGNIQDPHTSRDKRDLVLNSTDNDSSKSEYLLSTYFDLLQSIINRLRLEINLLIIWICQTDYLLNNGVRVSDMDFKTITIVTGTAEARNHVPIKIYKSK